MKSIMRKAAAYGLVLAMGCTSLAGCGKNGAKIDGSKTLMTVNGEDLRMGVASFYTRFQQAQMYQFYSMYFGSGASIFDTVEDEATGKTYGDDIKEEALNELKKLVTINQHADEYGVSLTDEQKANITAAAEAYIASNDQAVLDKVGAAKEDVEKLLTLQTVQSLMMDPIVKDVDREVPDEDAQQTTLTYVAVNVAEDETSETSEAEAQSEAATSEAATSEATTESEAAASETAAVESEAVASETAAVESEAAASETAAVESEAAVSETAAVESEAAASETAAVESEAAASETAAVESEAAASETAAVESEAATSESEAAESEEEETEAQQAARADAEAILEAVMAESMIAEADMDAIARTVDDTYYAATGQFTTNDPADADVDSSVAEAAAGLEDGELVDHVVKSADGTRYYVVRVDHVFDEEATAEKKKSIIEERKQTLYDETTDGWVESADIKVDENVWKTLTLTDMEPVTLKAPEVQSEAESAVSEQETAESTVSSAAAAAESTVSSAAETAESTVSSAAAESTVSSAAEAADSAVTSAVETAESTVASVAAAVDSAAESAAGTAAAVESKVEAAAEELESTVEGLESAAETVVNEYEDAVASTVQGAAAEAVSVAEAVENTVTSTVSAAEAAVSQAAETANTAAASSGKTNAAAEAAAAAAAAAAADLSGSAAK